MEVELTGILRRSVGVSETVYFTFTMRSTLEKLIYYISLVVFIFNYKVCYTDLSIQ